MAKGVGKTTLSVTLAASLRDTCLLDFDPQGSASTWAIPEGANLALEVSDVLTGNVKPEKAIIPTDMKGLYVLPIFGIGGGLKKYAGERQIVRDILAASAILRL